MTILLTIRIKICCIILCRYVLDSKWEKTFLTYRIVNYPQNGLSKAMVDKEVELAFQFWTNATNIHVKRNNGPADVS